MARDDRMTPEQLGMKELLGEIAPRLKEGSPLQEDVEALHLVVYTAPARKVAEEARDLAERLKAVPGMGDFAGRLLDDAKHVKF
ncbi:hypothetical protein ACVKXF_001042 [Curtobacterium sp. PvP017]